MYLPTDMKKDKKSLDVVDVDAEVDGTQVPTSKPFVTLFSTRYKFILNCAFFIYH